MLGGGCWGTGVWGGVGRGGWSRGRIWGRAGDGGVGVAYAFVVPLGVVVGGVRKAGGGEIPWVGETGMGDPGAEEALSGFVVVAVFVLEDAAPKDGLFGSFRGDVDAVLERVFAFADEGLGGVEAAFHGLVELLAVDQQGAMAREIELQALGVAGEGVAGGGWGGGAGCWGVGVVFVVEAFEGAELVAVRFPTVVCGCGSGEHGGSACHVRSARDDPAVVCCASRGAPQSAELVFLLAHFALKRAVYG